jgi:hypothetical protein
VFDKPPLLPMGESFANLIEDATARAIGVAYEIAAGDLAHIELTEGVGVGNYRAVEIEIALLGEPASLVPGRTLVSERRDESLRPSQRYMELVIAGATLHGLPAEHIEHLRSIEARPSTPEAKAFQTQIEEWMRQVRGGGR